MIALLDCFYLLFFLMISLIFICFLKHDMNFKVTAEFSPDILSCTSNFPFQFMYCFQLSYYRLQYMDLWVAKKKSTRNAP
mmetsp:Transcript_880/g.1318  ORF Transcript_880/g.1318 Transcript_880/m.1318 type:complete len:80 (-) Transcript_880:296-535(-)